MTTTLPITSLYAAVFGLLLIPITIAVGMRRMKTRIAFLGGDDETLLRRMRSHANFVETVPLALLLMALTELNGASAVFMHVVGATLLVSRIVHYVTLNVHPTAPTRSASMIGTLAVLGATAGFLIRGQF